MSRMRPCGPSRQRLKNHGHDCRDRGHGADRLPFPQRTVPLLSCRSSPVIAFALLPAVAEMAGDQHHAHDRDNHDHGFLVAALTAHMAASSTWVMARAFKRMISSCFSKVSYAISMASMRSIKSA